MSKGQLLSELMKEAQAGNSTSYETLLIEVNLILQSYLNSKIFNKSQVDDVIQETLMAVHKSRHTYDSNKSFMSWLLAIAHYKISDHLRSQFKYATQELDDTFMDPKTDALNSLIENQSYQIINQALDELDHRPKEIVKLLKVEGLKVTEVAARMQLSESNIKVIAHRAYQILEIKLRSRL